MRRLADRFVLEREVGSGGMARVFLGRDEVLDRPVAVKVLKPMHGETEIAARFRREGRTAARLSHPNIVQVYDAGEGDLDGNEVSYIVMEYLSGGDLKERIDERGPLPDAEISRFGEQVCAGLAHAHGRGIIHRDIKPHNILLDEKGRAKVSDFGIARALDTTQATRTGAYLGTALYSSPEQLQGYKVTPKSDVYSLGATLYQAATGEPPFTGTPIEVASQHVSKPPPPLKQREGGLDVGEEMEALILSCLAKNADDRPSAEEALERFASAAPAAAPIPPTAQAEPAEPERERPLPAPTVVSSGGRTQRRGRTGGVLAALAIVAVLAVIGAFILPDILRSGGNTTQNNAQQNQQANAGGANAGNGSNENQDSRVNEAAAGNTSEPTTQNAGNSDQSSAPTGGGSGQDGGQSGGGSPEQAAEQTINDFYTSAADGDYQESAQLLTPSYRESTWSSQTIFSDTFDTLQSVQFVNGPTAEVQGNTATVTFSTVARHTNRVDRPDGTATLVREGDDWRIDNLSVG